MTMVEIPQVLVATTVAQLRSAEARETVLLWLAARRSDGGPLTVREVYLPAHAASKDFFHIPRVSMEKLLRHLAAQRLMVAAQVHTHPGEAFHSPADDRWAIVRHQGALSLVVPRFCRGTTTDTFVRHAQVFQVSSSGAFVNVPPESSYRVT